MNDIQDKEFFLKACFEEYKSLREESRQASVNMISSISIGMGAAALVTVAGITSWVDDQSNVPLFVFLFIIPLLLAVILSFWLGEAARFMRVGDYICFIELKVSMLLNGFYNNNIENNSSEIKWSEIQYNIENRLKLPHTDLKMGRPMLWEQWLRKIWKASKAKKSLARFFSTSGHMPWIYALRLGLQLIILDFSLGIGIYRLWIYNGFENINNTQWAIIISFLGIFILFNWFVINQSRKLIIKKDPIDLNELLSPSNS